MFSLLRIINQYFQISKQKGCFDSRLLYQNTLYIYRLSSVRLSITKCSSQSPTYLFPELNPNPLSQLLSVPESYSSLHPR